MSSQLSLRTLLSSLCDLKISAGLSSLLARLGFHDLHLVNAPSSAHAGEPPLAFQRDTVNSPGTWGTQPIHETWCLRQLSHGCLGLYPDPITLIFTTKMTIWIEGWCEPPAALNATAGTANSFL